MEDYYVTSQRVCDAIDEFGGFVQIKMDTLKTSNTADDKEVYERIISTIGKFALELGKFALELVIGIQKVVAERDAHNSAADEIPAVLPLDLFAANSRVFTSALQKQRIRLLQKFEAEEVEKIDDQFRSLRLAIREETGLKSVLEAKHSKADASFEECWSPLANKYNELKNFCGGVASVMPRTSSVESDFSLINWVKDPNSQQLTDFSLESIYTASSTIVSRISAENVLWGVLRGVQYIMYVERN